MILQSLRGESGNLLHTVDAVLVDVVPTVAALAAADGKSHANSLFGELLRPVLECADRIHAAGTAHAEIPFVFIVQVDESLARDESLLHGAGTVEAGFLRNGKQALHPRMSKRIIVQDRHRGRYADPIVGTERRVVGDHPAVFDHVMDRILGKVEVRGGLLFADHVGMTLQDDRGMILIPFGGRLRDHHIADFIGLAFKATGGCKLLQISDNLFLMP